jgi:DNA-binding IclR family transcriptional regulator
MRPEPRPTSRASRRSRHVSAARRRVGELQPVSSTGLGKALILDHDEESWANFFRPENGSQRTPNALHEWLTKTRCVVLRHPYGMLLATSLPRSVFRVRLST